MPHKLGQHLLSKLQTSRAASIRHTTPRHVHSLRSPFTQEERERCRRLEVEAEKNSSVISQLRGDLQQKQESFQDVHEADASLNKRMAEWLEMSVAKNVSKRRV